MAHAQDQPAERFTRILSREFVTTVEADHVPMSDSTDDQEKLDFSAQNNSGLIAAL
jgi:hypothetical protein